MTNYVNKLLENLNEDIKLKPDEWSRERMISAGNKRWITNILPAELLSRSVKQAVESLVTINESGEFYETFPDIIETPKYDDKWGRIANYIEINNRAIAEMEGERTKNGILSSIKLLPAIPPSAKSWANCIILSQIFPNIYGDGYNKGPFEENSIYGIKLNAGYSGNIIDYDINMTAEEQFLAFNDLAHLHGLKTGFRTVISADQIKVARPYADDEVFRWDNAEHQEMFIEEHVRLIKMGFEAVFIDSAKHIGGYDNPGLTTGTAFVPPDNYDKVKCWAEKLKYNRNYAPGVEVSNDNDEGGRSYEDRLNRINSILFGYEYPSDKLPSFMQMEDLFPLRYDTNTHHLMMTNPSYSADGTPLSHWENLFTKDDGRAYNAKVGELFSYAMNL